MKFVALIATVAAQCASDADCLEGECCGGPPAAEVVEGEEPAEAPPTGCGVEGVDTEDLETGEWFVHTCMVAGAFKLAATAAAVVSAVALM